MKKLIAIIGLCLLGSLPMFASSGLAGDTIRGLVVNAKGKAAKNVEIAAGEVKCVTNRYGFFQLDGVDKQGKLTIKDSQKGEKEVILNGIVYPKIQLDEADCSVVEDKEEVLKVVLRSVRRSRNTSGNVVVLGEELLETGHDNLLEALAGKVSGLNIITDDNGETHVKIRGAASFNLDTHPLYRVDNVEVERLDNINVADVVKVEVLKDSNIYGARGANGVISVTLK